MNIIDLSVFDCDIRVECVDRQAESLLNGNYCWFKRSVQDPRISYRITPEDGGEGRLITRNGGCLELARDDGEFLYMFEKDMTSSRRKNSGGISISFMPRYSSWVDAL